MPIYEYKCNECGEKFEKLRSFSSNDDELTCPKCGTAKPERVLSLFASAGSGGGSSADSCSTGGG